MALERMQVTNHERWGNLVKTWSTGKNYLDDDNEYPIPAGAWVRSAKTRQPLSGMRTRSAA